MVSNQSTSVNDAESELNSVKYPNIEVISQYIKDLSFEVSTAPWKFSPNSDTPEVKSNVGLHYEPTDSEDVLEVCLDIKTEVSCGDKTLFLIDIEYNSVFKLMDVSEEDRVPILMIYCPNLIFPFVRQIICNVTQNGGFQPLILKPINFHEMYYNTAKDLQ
ncbi:protein-export chaperone SecB [Rickettsia endosymbiont of Cardiosporidium cionae]|uniref:protein-export chaperone SecB n=1 Tax=Rickettsia endosymbiont of Cardiosporidium cionae TaxID=2777155 RepID=UPI001893DBDD|nr:protein-export chaperone SecB [Rickettsia endosymbiont of Cardiosporidium cionae]KAF8818820.1 protein-export chaperone SecB [Rickettsia endosymbiont of Cardiosporidium cionae]